MSKEVDITGLAVKARPGWEIRTKQLAKPEYFSISVGVSGELREGLSPKENQRLDIKLEMVRKATTYLCAGMVKGTVKYTGDDYTVEKWIANVVGEGADLFNYQILLANAFAKEKK